MNRDLLPSGACFAFWDDATAYSREYHVAQQHPYADDNNPGTVDSPFRSIYAAAQMVQPGEKVIVHAGVYRECVRPLRGGTGPTAMIAYEAFPGEEVVITGAERWTPKPQPGAGYRTHSPEGVWMADLPIGCYEDGYNPFLLRNAYQYLPVYGDLQDSAFLQRALRRRGALFVDGEPLAQAYHLHELAKSDGAFWVEEPGLRLHVRLPGDADPACHRLEVTVREQAFAPHTFGLGYIRVRGFTFSKVADGLPVPQRAAVSAMRGHHWIIENCTIEHANACGMDIGAQTWDAAVPDPTGGHIIRGNLIRQCGICGIAGALGVHHSLIEANTIEKIGGLELERMWECAGLKFHLAEHCLIRHNTFRHIHHASGIWLDCTNINNRITRNVFTDIACLNGAIYMEMNFDQNLIDHNIFWGIRADDVPPGQTSTSVAAVRADCNESLVVAHNFFGHVAGPAVLFSLFQAERKHGGRTGLNRANAALNNVVYHCAARLHLGCLAENVSDGNLYDESGDSCSFHISNPAPGNFQNLASWQRYFNIDLHSTQAKLETEFDEVNGILNWHTDGPLPATQRIDGVPKDIFEHSVGPNSSVT